MEDNQIMITLEDGSELLCEVILTYHSDETGYDYVVFEMPDGNVSAARYDEGDTEGGALSDIETDEEWDIINEVLEDYYDSLDEEDDFDGE